MFSTSSSSQYALYTITLIFLITIKASLGTKFTLVNRCGYTIWPGILSSAGSSGFGTTGFELSSRATRSFQAEPGWSGRFWARTGCSFDPATGQGRCATGGCNSNQIECNGAGATPPATLAEFTIGAAGAQDFYDVSLVDGYNLPMTVEADGGSGACGSTGCLTDLNRMCPNELRAGDGQACKSACEAFGSDEYCCSGAYGSPAACRPSMYSEMFKNACPRSYSYAYDDATSTFTCSGADYKITFCPSLTSQKSSRDPPAAVNGQAAGSDSEPEDDFLSWLPNFVSGGSSNSALDYGLIFCAPTIFVSLLFL